MKERLAFVKFWADYMKSHTNREWSSQQAKLINSVMRSSYVDPDTYIRIKKLVEHDRQ